MSRTRARTFAVDPEKLHQDGPLAGEPMQVRRRAPRLPAARESTPHGFPMMRAERQRLGFEPPDAEPAPAELGTRARARKFFGSPTGLGTPEPGQVPEGGTTGQPTNSATGSVLPTVSASRQIPFTPHLWSELILNGAVLSPPYDPWLLVCAVEESDILGPSIEIMATNIGGFGYDLTPYFPTKDEAGQPIDPPPEAQQEKATLELFLASLNLDLGFEGLLELVDRDVETTGNGYLEALRDQTGRVAQMEHLPAYTMRLGKLSQPILVQSPFRHPTTGQLITIPRWHRFRTFVQVREGRTVYFKEYGDPRYINWQNGLYQATPWGPDPQGNDRNGTEVIHRKIYCAHSEYGVPRWIGALPHVRAGRQAAELVCDWFESAPIGVKILMVAGGIWKQSSMEAALAQIDDQARGAENAWGFVALEADTATARDPQDETRDLPPRMLVEDAAGEVPEAVYRGEDSIIEGSSQRVRRMFRLPPIYYGDSQDYSRAAANTSRGTAEEQLFVPTRRGRWEVWLTNSLLPSMGVNFWGIRLRGANTSDDEATFKGLGPFIEGGGATPNQLIRLLNEMTGGENPPIDEEWANKPIVVTLKILELGGDPNLPLDEAVAGIQEQKAADAQAKADALAKLPQAGPPGAPGAGGPMPPKKGAVQKRDPGAAVEVVGQLIDLRERLAKAVREQGLSTDELEEARAAGWRA